MKKFLLMVIALLLMAVPAVVLAGTADVTFQWDPNAEPDLAGYRLYISAVAGQYQYGTASPNFVAEIPVGTTTYTQPDVPDGLWNWVLTAYDTEGMESGPSNEVSAEIKSWIGVPPANPGGFNITNIQYNR